VQVNDRALIYKWLKNLEHKFVNGRKNIYYEDRTKATRDTKPAVASVLLLVAWMIIIPGQRGIVR